MKITILVDNPDSWVIPYARELIATLVLENHHVQFVQSAKDINEGDIAFFIGCERIVPKQTLSLNKHNLVIHPSALPIGKGWSPLAWQILEGKSEIHITLFEANEDIDSGPIYFQDVLQFQGHELNDELKDMQGKKTNELALKFVRAYPNVDGKEQEGDETFYPRRTPDSSEIDIDKPVKELFDHFRVADNERYPIFFVHKNHKYILKIYKV